MWEPSSREIAALKSTVCDLSAKMDILRLRVDAVESCLDRLCSMMRGVSSDASSLRAAIYELSEHVTKGDDPEDMEEGISTYSGKVVEEKYEEDDEQTISERPALDAIRKSKTRPWFRRHPFAESDDGQD